MGKTFLKIENVSKKYGSFTALQDINVSIDEGEFVCLFSTIFYHNCTQRRCNSRMYRYKHNCP